MTESQYPPLPADAFCVWMPKSEFPTVFNSPCSQIFEIPPAHKTPPPEPLFTAEQMHAYIDADRAQRKPLTDEWMEENIGPSSHPMGPLIQMVVRKAEAAHGIKGTP